MSRHLPRGTLCLALTVSSLGGCIGANPPTGANAPGQPGPGPAPSGGPLQGFVGNPPTAGLPPAGTVSVFGGVNPYFPPLGAPVVSVYNRSPAEIAFAANVGDATHTNFDVFFYNFATQAVTTAPGINTTANEFNPQLSIDGRHLVYTTEYPDGTADVHYADFGLGVVDALPTLNTLPVQYAPTIDDTGTLIAYVARQGAVDTLRLFNLGSGRNFVPEAILAAAYPEVAQPTISGNGRVIAFGTTDPTGTHVAAYDVTGKTFLRVPFVDNPAAVDTEPSLSYDGTQMLFTRSVGGGHTDVLCGDLVTGNIDNLALLNSPYNESAARFLGTGTDRILFQSDRSGHERLYVFHRDTGVIDTLAIPQLLGGDQQLIAPPPPPIVVSPSPSASPTASPSASPTASPTASPSASPTASPTVSPSLSPSPSASP